MSKIKIVPFKKEHFDIYRERELERDMLGDLIEFFQSRTPEHGPSYTALLDNNVVAIAGVQIMFPGVGEGWVFGTELIYAHKFFFAKSVKRMLGQIMNDYGLHRVQAVPLKTFEPGCRFLEWLGFKYEGELLKYGPAKQNCLMYGRI
tara:strand:- start:97 stop:537 length:441 start_codon:yes stop_codon:yes gene_type:complete